MRRLTPAGAGGVCVLSLSGSDALERLRRLGVHLSREEALARGPVPRLVRLCLGGEELDEALLCVRGPEELELHLHASPPLVLEVERTLGRTDPEPGTRVLSLEDRAWRALASAPSEDGARVLLDQAEGALRQELEALAGLDGEGFQERVDALLEQARVVRWLLHPACVVLAGPVNAGKSTLFNVLLGHERALVADEPGTTRDAIRERALLGPWPVELVDTAGERGDGDELERAGQALARGLACTADLVLRLSPLGAEVPSMDGPALATCADRAAGGPPWPTDAISARLDPEGARRAVRAVFERVLRLPREPWCPGRGVPFEPAQVELLAALREAPGDERRRRLASVLEAGTV